jgi:uncharacterized integral membrane protein (TIGR00697 family)
MCIGARVDSLFVCPVLLLRYLPSLLVSLLSILFCNAAAVFLKRFWGCSGLCCFLAIASILGNVQVLYATSYEMVGMPVLLGTVTLSSSFFACDMINEFYGPEKARQAIVLSFVMQVFFIMSILLTLGHRPIDYQVFTNFSIPEAVMNRNTDAIKQIFLQTPRLLVASFSAYLASMLTETWLYRLIKIKNDIIRNNVSLFVSSIIIDTSVFTFIGLVLLSSSPLSCSDFVDIFTTACLIRVSCNIINSLFLKVEITKH